MKTFRQVMAIMALIIALCVVPCLLPAEIPENRAQIECGEPVRAQQDSDVVVDLSACQNACRMRYGPTPPTGHSATNEGVGETGKNPGATVEQSSPALYTQCMNDCERNYWKQFDEETSGSKRRR
jgi:hypothetical protein